MGIICLVAGCSSASRSATGTTQPIVGTTSPSDRPATTATAATSTVAEQPPRLPSSMVAIGHSGMTGYNSDPAHPDRDARENSWATGTNPDVDSIYQRLLALNPAIKDHKFNLARDGSDADDLISQAAAAIRIDPPPELVLIQSVDNDMRCDGHDDEFLPMYGARLNQALRTIADGDPGAQVFIISQPGSVESYTKAVQGNPIAVQNQSSGSPCDVFDKTGTILPAGEAYLEGVLQSYFAMIASECAAFANCRFDQTHDHALDIVSSDVTPDTNHFTVSGQQKVAAAVWEAMSSTVSKPATPPPPAACPNPDGGSRNRCVGNLTSGTHTTSVFQPALTYTVGEGWSNMEDLPGNFLLIPPGGSLAGVNPMTSDFIGVYTSVTPPLPCTEQAALPAAPTPQTYVDWLQAQPQLATTAPSPTTVGGLTGLQIDVSLVADHACSDPKIAGAYGLVLLGTGRSQLTHAVVPNYPLRLDLLSYDGGVLAIELADAPNGGSSFDSWWDAAAPVVSTFAFTPAPTPASTTSSP